MATRKGDSLDFHAELIQEHRRCAKRREPCWACCLPQLICHGAGGSENGMLCLAEALRDNGWRAVIMGHRESGRAPFLARIRESGLRGGLREVVTDPHTYNDRLMDIDATLQWAGTRCHAPFAVLLGHSMGAATVMMEARAQNRLGIAGKDRFDAYVAMSPQGPGSIFPPHAWSGIRKPLLMLTGTRDNSLEGDWQVRTAAYEDLPPGCKWLEIIDGATHLDFAGDTGHVQNLVTATVNAFLNGARENGRCSVPAASVGITLKAK